MDEKQTARFLFIDVHPLKVFWAQTVSELKSFDFQAVLSLFAVYIYIKRVERTVLMKHRRKHDENKQSILNVSNKLLAESFD